MQERKYGHVCVHTGGVSNAYSRIRTARTRVHGWVGTEKQCRRRVHGEATECIMFMGRQRNASCSSGGNGMRRVHQEALDGIGDGNEAWRTAERRKRPCVRPATFETGSCSYGGVWRTAKRRKQTSYGRNRVLLIGRGVAYRKTEETDLCWTSFRT